MAIKRKTRPQNMGQNRNVQMRNNARRSNPFQGGLAPDSIETSQPMQCPSGQQPIKNPMTGKMECTVKADNPVPKPRSGNRGY